MSSNADILLQQKYKTMIGLGSILCVSNTTILIGSASVCSNLYISGSTIMNSATVCTNLNILNNLIINANSTIVSNLNISNNTLIKGNLTINNNLYISANSFIKGNMQINSSLNVSGNTILNNAIVNSLNISNNTIFNNLLVNNLNISSYTVLNGNVSSNYLYISNFSKLQGNTSFLSNLLISGTTNLNNCLINANLNGNNFISQGNITINSLLNVTKTSILNNSIILNSINLNNNLNVASLNTNNLNISNYIICNLPEYQNYPSALAAGVPYWNLYRTGGIVKIMLDLISPIITLNGASIMTLYVGDTFQDPSVSITSDLNQNILPIVTGTVNTNMVGTYILSYIAYDYFNNCSNLLSRTVNVYNYPTISNVVLSSNIITFTTSGVFNIMSYLITQSSNIIVSETIITSNSINISSLTLSTTPYFIIIYLKRITNDILITNTIAVTNNNFGPMINRIGTNPLLKYLSSTYNLLNNITAVNLPSNSNISISSSNISIYNNLNQLITTPSNSILPISNGNSFTITYNITGSNNVSVSTTITTTIIDNIPPVITLLGNNPMLLSLGSSFIDPGYTVTDNSGQSITPTITGFVNPYILGNYTLTYTATDNSNNTTTSIRNILVAITKDIYRCVLLDTTDVTRGRFMKFNTNIISKLRQSNNWTIEVWAFLFPANNYSSGVNMNYYRGSNSLYPPPNTLVPNLNYSNYNNTIFTLYSNTNNITLIQLNTNNSTYAALYNIIIYWNNGSSTTYNCANGTEDGLSLNCNSWNHIAISYDGTNIRLYLNGSLSQYSYTQSNMLIGSNAITTDTLYIGVNNANLSDASINTTASKFNGYISQLTISNYCKYNTNFIPNLNLEPNNLNTCIFYLNNNFTDLISQNMGLVFYNGSMSYAIDTLPRLTSYNNNLIYAFPGSILINEYWCLHNKSIGKSWSIIDPLINPYNINQDFTNGLCIGFSYFIPCQSNFWNSNGYLSYYPAMFYMGSNPDDLTLPNLSFQFRDTDTQWGRLNYVTTTSSYTTNDFQLSYAYNYRAQSGRLLFRFFPNGNFELWFNGGLGYSTNIGFSNSTLTANRGLWIGRGANASWYGSIFNIKIYNTIVPWETAFQ
jgi:cytoskeletal protein CcmA (bactofilin family)